jgi:hypothetical protein
MIKIAIKIDQCRIVLVTSNIVLVLDITSIGTQKGIAQGVRFLKGY